MSTNVDYSLMNRRELQALCKKYKIPANKTNVFMAESLSALLNNAPREQEEFLEEEPPAPESPVVEKVVEKVRGKRAPKVAVLPEPDLDFLTAALASSTLTCSFNVDMTEPTNAQETPQVGVPEQKAPVAAPEPFVPRRVRGKGAKKCSVLVEKQETAPSGETFGVADTTVNIASSVPVKEPEVHVQDTIMEAPCPTRGRSTKKDTVFSDKHDTDCGSDTVKMAEDTPHVVPWANCAELEKPAEKVAAPIPAAEVVGYSRRSRKISQKVTATDQTQSCVDTVAESIPYMENLKYEDREAAVIEAPLTPSLDEPSLMLQQSVEELQAPVELSSEEMLVTAKAKKTKKGKTKSRRRAEEQVPETVRAGVETGVALESESVADVSPVPSTEEEACESIGENAVVASSRSSDTEEEAPVRDSVNLNIEEDFQVTPAKKKSALFEDNKENGGNQADLELLSLSIRKLVKTCKAKGLRTRGPNSRTVKF